jgi:uncharacterized protein (DUF362 family)
MDRRGFLSLPAAQAAIAAASSDQPRYTRVTKYKPWARPGMPGPYPGRVVSLHSPRLIDEATETVDAALLKETMRRGMTALSGDADVRDAWRRFIDPKDQVGIKLNCSGAPNICSHPLVVGEVVANLTAIGVPAKNITLYERFQDQVDTVGYHNYVPEGVTVFAASRTRDAINAYDPHTYVEVDFFGEEDTRSNMVKLVSERFNKIINIPNLKDHGASGVTGCLKNIAYGSFHNVARSHKFEKTNTLSFIGTLAATEPLRSRTVLQVMDGLKGVWHGGPFSPSRQFRYYPGRMLFGTDPVAIDRILLELIEAKRKAEGAVSVWNRSSEFLTKGNDNRENANRNRFIREPGHIEFAAGLGLGVYDREKIRLQEIAL